MTRFPISEQQRLDALQIQRIGHELGVEVVVPEDRVAAQQQRMSSRKMSPRAIWRKYKLGEGPDRYFRDLDLAVREGESRWDWVVEYVDPRASSGGQWRHPDGRMKFGCLVGPDWPFFVSGSVHVSEALPPPSPQMLAFVEAHRYDATHSWSMVERLVYFAPPSIRHYRVLRGFMTRRETCRELWWRLRHEEMSPYMRQTLAAPGVPGSKRIR